MTLLDHLRLATKARARHGGPNIFGLTRLAPMLNMADLHYLGQYIELKHVITIGSWVTFIVIITCCTYKRFGFIWFHKLFQNPSFFGGFLMVVQSNTIFSATESDHSFGDSHQKR